MSRVYAGKAGLFSGLFLGAILGGMFLKLLPLADFHPAFLLALPFVCFLCLGIVLRPDLVVILLLFTRALLDPVLNTTKGGHNLGFGAIMNLCVVLMTLWLVLFNAWVPLLKSQFVKRWLFFLIVCFAAAVYSPMRMMGMKLFFNLADYLCMAALPWLIHPERNDKKIWIKRLLFSSVLPVLFANLDLARGGTHFSDAGQRILGTFTHPNILGFYLVWVMALILYVWKSGYFAISGPKKFLLWGYFANVLLLLVATKTRNAWIGAWLLFFIYGILKDKKLAISCLALPICAFVVPFLFSRIQELFFHSSHRLNSFEWRLNVWKSTLSSAMERWAFGHGLATFREMSRDFLVSERKGVEAHNVYLQLLFETGLVGLCAYLSIFWWMLRTFYLRSKHALGQLSNEHAVAFAYTAVYAISSFGDNMLYYLALNFYCWFFWGVVLKSMQFQRLAVRF